MTTMKKYLILAVAAVILAAGCSQKEEIGLYTISNGNGMEVSITNYGGRIVSLMVPDRDGNLKDVVLGFDDLEDYRPENNQTDFGASIGRYANRINQGLITIDGETYQLPQNNFGHCLHGGPDGWQYRPYKVVEATGNSLKLQIVSPDGDANFPGTVTATVTFTLTEDNALNIDYEAVTDKATVINMTNHAYFNLSGDPAHHSITEDILQINASCYTPMDSTFMTTGEIAPVEGTPFDFREPKFIGLEIDADDEQIRNGHGYDHNWVLDGTEPAATLYCPETGICLEVSTDEPGIQVYCGNFLDGSVVGKGGIAYPFRSAICLETQHYPDSPNKPEWPSVILRPGETYHSHCTFSFSVR